MSKIKIIKTAIAIVNVIKDIADSNITKIIVALTHNKVDDAILEKLNLVLPKLLETFNKFDDEFKPDGYDFLATQISVVLADGKLSWHDVKYILKQVYHTTKEG